MNQSERKPNNKAGNPRNHIEDFGPLIVALGSKDKSVRGKARESLLEIGEPSTGALVKALSDPNGRVRFEAATLLDQINVHWTRHADAETVEALASDLCSEDGLVRVRVRMALVAIGAKAVDSLAGALKSKQEVCRWEAAKALSQIRDHDATGLLVKALEDESFGVRWLASEGLIAIGNPALVPLLSELVQRPDSVWMREGVHRILHGIQRKGTARALRPLLNALEDAEAELSVAFAAKAALDELRNKQGTT